MGLATFVAAFRRPLFAIFQEIFPLIERAREGAVDPDPQVIDEMVIFVLLLPLASTSLRARVSSEISCSDASLWGGGAAVAETARRPTVAAVEEDDPGVCARCGGDVSWGQHGQFYPCPASCGRSFCSIWCVEQHRTERCSRRNYLCPTFAEFFPEAGQPLTEAMALNRVAVLPAFGPNVSSADDFWSPAGKDKMERMEADPLVAAKFWTPPFSTFGRGWGEQVRLGHGR